jgi:hypothetical protein
LGYFSLSLSGNWSLHNGSNGQQLFIDKSSLPIAREKQSITVNVNDDLGMSCTLVARAKAAATPQYPPRPTTPPPPIHLFHQTDNSITLTTIPNATDDQITALLFQLRDAAHNQTFDALHIPQKLVDARDPMIWFHLYRGPKCAAEKYAPGAPPCGPSYHAAGDYTLGSISNPNWDSAVLLTPSTTDQPHETQLWPPGSPYTPPHP